MLSSTDLTSTDTIVLSTTLRSLAQQYEIIGDTPSAITNYTKSCVLNPKSVLANLLISKLYIKQKEYSEACKHLKHVLNIDAGHEEAAVIMAELLFRQGLLPASKFHYLHIIQCHPQNYNALEQLIVILHLTNNLDECTQVFAQLDNDLGDSGLAFCRGLYLKFLGDVEQSMRLFAGCRKDGIWGLKATKHLIGMYLNPSQRPLGIEMQSSAAPEKNGIIAAREMVGDLGGRGFPTEFLECECLIASQIPKNIETAISIYSKNLAKTPECTKSLHGISIGHVLLNQKQKAKPYLKKIVDMEWCIESHVEIESSLILLSELLINAGKPDRAVPLLKKAVQANQSCCTAWEYLGTCAEKHSDFVESAECYRQSWAIRKSTWVGYRLACMYLKSAQYTHAIDVCHDVLQVDAGYACIRSDVLVKARSMLRG